MTRISWDEYYINISEMIKKRATCPRKRVGSVIVNINNRIVGTGYNGAPAGLPHCDDKGCIIENNHCIRTIHSELNAIIQAGEKAKEATLYTTCLPCYNCMKTIIQSGIKRVVYIEHYGEDPITIHDAKKAGVKLEQWKN